MSFYAVVRDKHRVVSQVHAKNRADPGYRYTENGLYDEMISQLFDSGFHRGDRFQICFARRGNSDRNAALERALDSARTAYEQGFGVTPRTETAIRASTPKHDAGLQAVDYFLWSLQRLYETGEDRFWEIVSPKTVRVYDVDDLRTSTYGVFYTKKIPLTRALIARERK